MKILRTDYTFDASASSVTFTDAIDVGNLYVIFNVTRGEVIYNLAGSVGVLTGQVLLLNADTTAHDDADTLSIIYEDPTAVQQIAGSVTVAGQVSAAAIAAALDDLDVDFNTASIGALATAIAIALDDLDIDINAASVAAIATAINTALRLTPLPISGAVTTDVDEAGLAGLIDTALRTTPLPVSGDLNVDNSALATAIASALDDLDVDLNSASVTALATAIATALDDLDIDINAASITALATAVGTAVLAALDNALTIDGTVAVTAGSGFATAVANAIATALDGVLTVDGTMAVTAGGGFAAAVAGAIFTALDGALTVDINGMTDGSGPVTVDGTVSISGSVDTELPAAGVLGDAMANPTTPLVGAAGLLWVPGTSDWRRAQGDSTGRALVVVKNLEPGYTATDLGKREDDIHASLDVGVMSLGVRKDTAAPGNADGDYGPLMLDEEGYQRVALKGWLPYNANALAGTQAALLTTPCRFGGIMLFNLTSAPAYLQVFDANSAVTVGTTAPTFVIAIPANSTPANGAGVVMVIDGGIQMTAGLRVASTTTRSGSTGAAVNGVILYATPQGD